MAKVYGFHKSGTSFFGAVNEYLMYNNKNQYKLNLTRGLVDNYDENTKYVIHIRNPIDLLVSAFYSFGYIHKYSEKHKHSYEEFMNQRTHIQNIGLDKYCLEYFKLTILPLHVELFKWLEIHREKPNVFISRYEKMKNNFREYIVEMGNFLDFDEDTIDCLYNEMKPQIDFKPVDNKYVIEGKIDPHCRNGTSKQYLTELKQETYEYLIAEMNKNIPEFMKTYLEFNL